jgi:hypothetical protein
MKIPIRAETYQKYRPINMLNRFMFCTAKGWWGVWKYEFVISIFGLKIYFIKI